MTAYYNDIKDKPILITGALRGIGKSIAIALAKNNAKVIINYRSRPEEADAFLEELNNLGAAEVHKVKFDISKPDEVKTSLESFVKEHGAIEGIVNNAGISKDQLLLRLKPEDIHTMIDTNLKGAIFVTQALSRSLLRVKEASVVNISSIVGLMGNPGQIAYASSKAGLIGFTKSLAKELGSRNLRSNAICPGFIATEMTDELDEKTQQQYRDSIPLGDFGSGEDIANATLFLLSNASKYITGEVIKVDGGIYI